MNDLISSAGGSVQNGKDALICDTTTQNFAIDVIEPSMNQPVLVDFWAPWCGPCHSLTPIIEDVVQKASGRVKLAKLNIDEFPEIPGQMGIQSIPAIVAVSQGRPVDAFMGVKTAQEINAFIEKIAGPGDQGDKEALEAQAEQALAEGQFDQAEAAFNALVQREPANLMALAGLARSVLGLGERERALEVLANVPEAKRDDPAIKAVLTQIELMEKADSVGDIDVLLQKIDKDEDDHQARFDLAIALNSAGKRQDAADALLEIIKRDRMWKKDLARQELLAFFEAWGALDNDTKSARRKLSAILFS